MFSPLSLSSIGAKPLHVVKKTTARGGLFLSALVGATTLLGGCATSGIKPADWPSDLPQQVELRAVPFFPQTEYYCGPAALATALGASGVEIAPARLANDVYLPKRKGTLQTELTASVRAYARIAYTLAPNPLAAWREVAAGRPVIVLQNLGLSWYPRWHYAVMVGFDRPRREVILRSGPRARYIISESLFMRTWARSNYWALTILPPDALPATAEELPYLQAAAALEHARQFAAARQAYETALARWPDSATALLGIGNSAYAAGDLSVAEAAYRRATRVDPRAGPAWNNLALILAARGAFDDARQAALQAVAIGGAMIDEYRRTLQEIAVRRAKH